MAAPRRIAKKNCPGGVWPANFPWTLCGEPGCGSGRAAQDINDWPRHYASNHPGVAYNAANLIRCTYSARHTANAANAAPANAAPAIAAPANIAAPVNIRPPIYSGAPVDFAAADDLADVNFGGPLRTAFRTYLHFPGYENVTVESTMSPYVPDNTIWWCEHCYCNIGNLQTTIEHIADVHNFNYMYHNHVWGIVTAEVLPGHDVTDLDPTSYDAATGRTWVLVGRVKTG